jgi:hypothetical protein
MEPRNRATPGCRRAPNTRKATPSLSLWREGDGPGGVEDLWHAWKHGVRNPGAPASGLVNNRQVRTVNLRDTTVRHGGRESDRSRVPRKPANKGCPKEPAEEVEGRERAKGNAVEHTRGRTQGREPLSHVLDGVRQAPSDVCALSPKARARCGSAARRDLCGGRAEPKS